METPEAVWRLPEDVARSRTRLNQPMRAMVGLVELVLAAATVLLGVWCWHHASIGFVYPIGSGQPPLSSTRLLGNWAGAAVGLCTVAGLLVLDALRQFLLAARARHRRKDARLLAALREAEASERALDAHGTNPVTG